MGGTRAAVVGAALFGLVVVAGIAVLLGFPVRPSLAAGVLAAVLLGGIVLAAAVRAGALDEDLTPPMPRHPGPPDHE